MNSYPLEFLAHPQPLMFVAGLTASSPSSRERSLSTASASTAPQAGPSSRRGSVASTTAIKGTSTFLDPVQAQSPSTSPSTNTNPSAVPPSAVLTTPVTSPGAQLASLPTSPPPPAEAERVVSPGIGIEAGESVQSPPPAIAVSGEAETKRDEEFAELVQNLRGALESKRGKGKVWIPDVDRRDFRIVLVDKGVRLPTRKVHPNPNPSTSQNLSDPSAVAHSPLSPFTPSSPLYPDGLIAPVWIRKYAELVPSVFVLFLRLFESPIVEGDGELCATDVQEREAKEREADEALVKEIGERRRRLGERGIKLTVVLMASAATLDSPALDPRLSYLRRASALSAKASLFVLTPVPAEQLPDFVQSLQDALYDSALEYYSSHAKRVRRKRQRLPTSPPGSALHPAKGLSPQGWAVRYDWKAGWFAEIRGDFETARRHYEDCWNELARMFSSTQIMPPRTKRWAEAKVLADCVAVRICRLLLYDDGGVKVLGPFFVHLKRFGDLSRGWGIGEDTFEFWSWLARQYRIFAELLELGVQSGLRIPTAGAPVFPTAAAAAIPPTPEYFSTPMSSANPLQILHQPAFYFYIAASCSIQRQKRFEDALEAEQDALASEAGAASGYVSTAPGFANEKKVDHAALVIELFTKSYSLLKEQRYAQDRVALFVAFRIAETYCQSGQYDMAMRFFERISPSFKKDKWAPVVREIRTLWYECAQRTGNVEDAARLLVEMMCPGSGVEGEDRSALQDDLLSLLKTTAPPSADPVVVDFNTGSPLLDVQAGFWQESALVAEEAPFQIILTCPEAVEIANLGFSTLSISFSDSRPDLLVKAAPNVEGEAGDEIDAGTLGPDGVLNGCSAFLRWSPGRRLVINGKLQHDLESEIRITGIKLGLDEGSWNLNLTFTPAPLRAWVAGGRTVLPLHDLSPSVSFETKPHVVEMSVTHDPTAYAGERLPVLIKVENKDDRELQLRLSLFLQPSDEADGSTVTFDEQSSSTLLKDVDMGTIRPGSSVEKSFFLHSPLPATKVIDVSLQSAVEGETLPGEDDRADMPRAEEIDKTIVIPVLAPFEVVSNVSYRNSLKAADKGMISEAVVSSLIATPGPRAIWVESVQLRKTAVEEVDLVSSSLNASDPVAVERLWDDSASFSVMSRFAVHPPRRPSLAGIMPESPAELVFQWRSETSSTLTKTSLPLPPLLYPQRDSFLSATLQHPTSVHFNRPFPVTLTIINAHPTQPASDLRLQGDTADAFVWTGSRSAFLPEIEAGGELQVNTDVVAVGGTGWFTLPSFRVFVGQGEARQEIPIGVKWSDGDRKGMVFVRP